MRPYHSSVAANRFFATDLEPASLIIEMDFEDIPAAEEEEVVYSPQEEYAEIVEEYVAPAPVEPEVYSMPEPEVYEEDALT